MDAVKEYGGCPLKVRTDCGTENGLVAPAQCFFIGNDLAHIYGTSPHKHRIEGWWSYLRQHLTTWWINFFKALLEQQVFTTGNELQMECLWFCFATLIQQDLDRLKEHWNTHYIRESRHNTVKGRPNELFYLPELRGTEDFLAPVTAQQCNCITENYLSLAESTNKYQEYFQYAFHAAGLSNRQN